MGALEASYLATFPREAALALAGFGPKIPYILGN
jgi:hypothetical protein